MNLRAHSNGSVLITCTIMLVVVSVMAVGLAAISGANLEIADNQQEANRAFANAESGLEVMQYWLSRVKVPSATAPADYFSTVLTNVRSDLQIHGVSNFRVNTDGSIPTVTLDTTTGQSFTGQWSSDPADPTILQVLVCGSSRSASRTIAVNYSIAPYRFPIFNYGIATKGPIRFPQNPTLTGALQNWEADIYVESSNSLLAVQVGGNTNFDGDIDIGNPLANVDFQGDVRIADDHGQAAIDEHVTIGADPVEFPVPLLPPFRPYATGPVITPTTNVGNNMTLVNATIQAGTNPTFLGNITIQGILFIEFPNIVTFSRNVSLQGLIVADGDAQNPGASQIRFAGNFASGGYPNGAQFDALRQEIGSSILAPGFAVSFTGNFSSVNGVLAASSLYFSGNASAIVKGTMISYSPDATMVEGNISMDFDRADAVEIPAGFDLFRVLRYNRASYTLVY